MRTEFVWNEVLLARRSPHRRCCICFVMFTPTPTLSHHTLSAIHSYHWRTCIDVVHVGGRGSLCSICPMLIDPSRARIECWHLDATSQLLRDIDPDDLRPRTPDLVHGLLWTRILYVWTRWSSFGYLFHLYNVHFERQLSIVYLWFSFCFNCLRVFCNNICQLYTQKSLSLLFTTSYLAFYYLGCVCLRLEKFAHTHIIIWKWNRNK